MVEPSGLARWESPVLNEPLGPAALGPLGVVDIGSTRTPFGTDGMRSRRARDAVGLVERYFASEQAPEAPIEPIVLPAWFPARPSRNAAFVGSRMEEQ